MTSLNETNIALEPIKKLFAHPAVFGMRTLFYALLPSESSYAKISDIPHYVDDAFPFFLTLIVLERILLRIQKRKKPRSNDAFSSIAAGLVSQLPTLLMRNVEIAAYIWVHEHWCLYELPWDSAVTWWLALLGVDVGYYWVHRCAHEINFMWAGHQTHHNSEEYNLSTALRQGVLQKYSSWIFYLPLALFIPSSVFVVHIQFNLLYQFWIHTEVVDRLGPLELVLNTPSHHRVHHGRNRYCIDKNYAGVLIIWDRMFGTFEAERKEDAVVYGVTHPINSWNPVYTQLNHWWHILTSVWQAKGFKTKVFTLLKGPGWQPGKPRLGLIEDVPDVHAPVPKYNAMTTKSLNVYCWVQFLLALALYHVLIEQRMSVEFWPMFAAVLFILWTLTNIGSIYDNRWYSSISELLRCIVYLMADTYLSGMATGHVATALMGVKAGAITCAIYWLQAIIHQFSGKQQSTKKDE